jgi:hypothetical protein
MDSESKKRVEAIEANAKAKVLEGFGLNTMSRDNTVNRNAFWFKRHALVPPEPIFIASSEDIGTHRVRANHPDAVIHYFTEQETLKKEKRAL